MSYSTIEKHARAKLNLMLHITGRNGGYHSMQSIFIFPDSLYDTLIFHIDKEFNESSAAIKNIKNSDNLIHKSRELLKNIFPRIKIHHVEIIKNIPIGAGLGGGSSDAACFINNVMDFNNIPQSEQIDFAKIAHCLGMDVPIFLYSNIYKQNTLLLNGTGKFDEIKHIPNNSDFYLVIVNNGSQLNTKSVFENLSINCFESTKVIKSCELSSLKICTNSLQKSAIKILPLIKDMIDDIDYTDPIFSRMSGSGSSCFGVYKTKREAIAACKCLQKKGYSTKIFKNTVS